MPVGDVRGDDVNLRFLRGRVGSGVLRGGSLDSLRVGGRVRHGQQKEGRQQDASERHVVISRGSSSDDTKKKATRRTSPALEARPRTPTITKAHRPEQP